VPYLRDAMKDCEVVTMGNLYSEEMWRIFLNVNPDVVFVDFCDQNAVVLTDRVSKMVKKPKIVIRLHAFEAFEAFIRNVNWGMVDELVCVSEKYREIVASKVGHTGVNIRVIHNGVNMDRFKLQEDAGMGDDIAYVSYLNRKKGIALLRTVMASMQDKDFHIGGGYQEEVVQLYLQDLNLSNVSYYGHIDTSEFFKGKRFILSTSVSESFGMTIAEGMAMGLTPMVHGWPGAELLWPKECIWNTFDELKNIEPKDPAWCRQWIEDRYSMGRCIDEFVKILLKKESL